MSIKIIAALIGAIGVIFAAIISKKLSVIHVLVNSRLSEALTEIVNLKATITEISIKKKKTR